MSPKYKHLAAAWALAMAAPVAPVALAAVCSEPPVWAHLAPPAWAEAADLAGLPGFASCGAAVEPAELDLTALSLYAGARFITWDAVPLPFALLPAGLARTGRPAAPAVAAQAQGSDGEPTTEALALLVAGFLGVSLGALRRRDA